MFSVLTTQARSMQLNRLQHPSRTQGEGTEKQRDNTPVPEDSFYSKAGAMIAETFSGEQNTVLIFPLYTNMLFFLPRMTEGPPWPHPPIMQLTR